jgi:hypothetical protein
MKFVERTFGGIPADQAWHWNTETYQMFGAIIFNLSSGDTDLRKKGHMDFYEFKRHFTDVEFYQYFVRLEEFRTEKRFKTITTMLHEQSEDWIESGKLRERDDYPATLPTHKSVVNNIENPYHPLISDDVFFNPENCEQGALLFV